MSESSAKEVTKDTVVHYSYSRFFILEEALKAIFKCLGVDTNPPQEDSSSNSDQQKDEQQVDGTSPQETYSSTEQSADPPSTTTATDPEADPPSGVTASTKVLSAPPRPKISSGSGPQIN